MHLTDDQARAIAAAAMAEPTCSLDTVLHFVRLAAGPLCFLGGVLIGVRLGRAS